MSYTDQEINEAKSVCMDSILTKAGYEKQKASGKYHCPFHEEKTPSFKVYKDTNLGVCFGGCTKTKAINSIQLYQHLYNVDFRTAVSDLTGIENNNNREVVVVKKQASKHQIKQLAKPGHREIYQHLFEYVHGNICQQQGIDYVAKRWVSERNYYLNFAFTGANQLDYGVLSNHMKKVYDLELLKESGLFNQRGNLVFGTDTPLLMFYRLNNEVYYIEARRIDESKEVSKYKCLQGNIKQPPFNYDCIKAMSRVIKSDRILYVNEGVFDCLSNIEMGRAAIATGGTSKIELFQSDKCIQALKRYEISVVVNFDNEPKAQQIASDIVETLAGFGIPASIELPGKDANADYITRCLDKAFDIVDKMVSFTNKIDGKETFHLSTFRAPRTLVELSVPYALEQIREGQSIELNGDSITFQNINFKY